MSTFWDRYQTDPGFAARLDEDMAALAESSAWTIQGDQPITGPGPCESCGTQIATVWERPWRDPEARWRPQAWELHGGGIRHTLRRCTWQYQNAGLAAA